MKSLQLCLHMFTLCSSSQRSVDRIKNSHRNSAANGSDIGNPAPAANGTAGAAIGVGSVSARTCTKSASSKMAMVANSS